MRRSKSFFFYAFSSFFGALVVAAFFAYYNYKFKEYKFINFNDFTLYEKNKFFQPKEDIYYLLVYNSKTNNIDNLIKQIDNKYPIIAVDFFQKRFENRKNVLFVATSVNNMIKIIQKLNIYDIPVVVRIKRFNKNVYKQDSVMEVLK